MSNVDWTDFNDPLLSPDPFDLLGPAAAEAVKAAWMGLRHDKEAPRNWAAACVAAALALPQLVTLAKLPPSYAAAIADISQALQNAAGVARDKQKKKTGTKRNLKALEFQGRVVLAISWLQSLKPGRITEAAALDMAAKQIPEAMWKAHKKGTIPNRSPLDALSKWREAFSETRASRNDEHQQVLRKLRHEVWGAWEGVTWREPVLDPADNPIMGNDGAFVYGEELTRDSNTAPPEYVLEWVRTGLL